MAKKDGSLVVKVKRGAAIVTDLRLTHAERVIGATLLLYFHNTQTGRCFPSYPQLAEKAGVTENTAKRAVSRMKAFGHVEFEKNTGGRNRRNEYLFDLTISPAIPFSDGNGIISDTLSSEKPYRQRSETVSPGAQNRIASDTRNYPGESPSETPSERARSRSTLISADAKIAKKQIEIAAEIGINPIMAKDQFARFKAHHRAKGSKFANWDEAWRKWCLDHQGYQKQHNPNAGKKRYFRRNGEIYDRQETINGLPALLVGAANYIPESEIEDLPVRGF
ncbi:helix-turn-helix domain-containing protein [Methyloceanibacter sp.]|uniref:helix-turn-helix domain-containing protein n=1 Tax=Methyloceanibacter sp. TaxID=1965321 RepID=UPI003D6D86DF